VSDTQDLVRERRGPLLLLRLARPEARNALTPGLLSGIGAAVHDAESDPEVRAVVLTGTGDRSFCAGMDLRAFAAGEQIGVGGDDATRTYFRLIDGEVSVPLVGAANGSALAGGFELLLACDVIVASTAAQFGLPEVKRGLFPAGNGAFLGSRIPLGVALEMALTGDPISAARAHELGLVNVLAPPESVLDAALAVAERIAANGPLGLAAARELVRLGVSDATRARARRDEWQQIVFSSEDAKEGALAFVEKRPPVWRGR
jgi:enoyl-CoA hydratase/carnithine racemase